MTGPVARNTSRWNRTHAALHLGLVVACLLGLSPAKAGASEITVEGKRSPENRFDYIWTVTNHSDKRITMLLVDHYYGKTVMPPKGWVRANMTGNWGEGQKLEPGIIEYRVEQPRKSIRRGQSKDFKVNVDRVWRGYCERRTVTIGFADGTTMQVADVLCPAKEGWFKRNVALVGLGALFALFLLYKVIFGRKPNTSIGDGPSD